MGSNGQESEKLLSLQQYHVSEDYGFILPEPLDKLPPYFQPWMDVAGRATQLICSHSLRTAVEQMPLLESHFLQSHRELRLAHLALSVMAMGYVWQEGEEGTVQVLPENLAIPYWEVSQRLGMPPILTHADGVLANWMKKDPKGPLDIENLELLFSLPGGDSVRGFFLVTLMVEIAGAPGVKVIPDVISGVRYGDVAMVTRALDVISQAIDSMKEALKLMHDHVDPSVFYGTLRIFLSGWKDNPAMAEGLVYQGVRAEPMEFSGGSAAQSSLLHCFDQLLGVTHEGKNGAFLIRMRDYMPPSHKRFIEDVSRAPSLRAFVRGEADESLVEAYARCVARLVDLRSYHINVVSRFISVPASRAKSLRADCRGSTEGEGALVRAPLALEERGTGGSGIMSFLKAVRDRTGDAVVTLGTTD
ncbi:indoleamine 2,3-dioxygenase 1 [Brachyhypopomus gauderio]|uniref:indoleamine 2,3-dioxygenase 1 n=1 Tax=Brachyhypopomus gauderio TaxID=698409 RepID=UPI004042A888